MKNTLQGNGVCLESSGPEGASNTTPALDINQTLGGPVMPVARHYTDSAPADNPEQPENTWRTIGEVIARDIAPEIARRVREKQAEGGE